MHEVGVGLIGPLAALCIKPHSATTRGGIIGMLLLGWHWQ
jgi:hypothetical protein